MTSSPTRSVRRTRRTVVARAGALVAPVVDALRPVSARVAPVLRPVRDTVSALGWAVLVLTGLAWWAGLHYRWAEIVAAAVVGTVALAVAGVLVAGRLRYDVRLDMAGTRVVVGERAVGRVVVTNPTTRPMLPAVMELPVGQGLATFPVPRLRGGAEHEDVFAVPTRKRAVIPVGPVRSVRQDPLGLLRRQVAWTGVEDLYVHPRTTGLMGSSSGFLRDLEGQATQDISNSDVSFHALRDYVAGDDRRHIHWKSTARTGQLMVRQFEETRRSHLAVILSTRAEDYAHDEEFELAVSVCGSLGLQAIREDRGLTVLSNHGTLRGDSRIRLLDDLSGVGTTSLAAGLAELARASVRELDDASVVVLIVGSNVSPATLRAASARMPVDVRVVAARCVPGEPVSRRTISDLLVVTIGGLDDLPRAMRAVTGG
ncbi:DUF58 domain-containing protein [Luteimicrobium subarcticum]|uniref:Uncharacterized protein (DUF58 family) n=1 Tax=Luteimicrobium subarcticum TaxID=620910 RepID=A0A2M8WVP3_9MICO|nr:DUF58 domain-containing protein [Luteimicrobium subarcticum]PJI94988.1 uncharacterized protein (DUF58 family) [Luteimicrobium subarcticum]